MDIDRRLDSRVVSAEDLAAMDRVRRDATALLATIETDVPAGRARAVAVTHLETTVMWAVKGIAHDEGSTPA